MAPKLLKTESQGARQCKTAQSSAGRASPALPVSSRRGGRQRPRPVKSQPEPQPQLPPPLTALGAGRRVPDSPRGVRSALAARAECPGLPQPRRRPGRPYRLVVDTEVLAHALMDCNNQHTQHPEAPVTIQEGEGTQFMIVHDMLFAPASLLQHRTYSLAQHRYSIEGSDCKAYQTGNSFCFCRNRQSTGDDKLLEQEEKRSH
ncbi:hypothetical protein NDU88_002299 [Pleurodeles waltl]|uniref:Uncharacterized protein n=1 Tax=Pleurodeles waltl TaxID=8319 RepID=A0AAV7UV65_PLEWA|nr:hypothetical protein NDU88_002299 [Pleurodeles waltl]